MIWWDPSVLPEAPEGNFGLREEHALKGSAEQAAEGMARYQQWKTRREEAIASGSRPSLDVFAATESTALPEAFVCEVRLERIERTGSRPSGARFGSLVHQVLRAAPPRGGGAKRFSERRTSMPGCWAPVKKKWRHRWTPSKPRWHTRY